jgi:hypothetical protein
MKNQIIKNKQKKQDKKRRRQKINKAARNRKKQLSKNLVFRLYKTIVHYFPDLFEQIRQIEDYRKKGDYELAELITASIALYLFKKGSRNALNNERQHKKFEKNYRRIFKFRLPHMDTVDKVMRQLDESHLEALKAELVRGLVRKKVFSKYRFLGKYYTVAVDGTHIMTVPEGHCASCLHRTSKNGKVTYFHNVLEAKLVCGNGFAISLATEWIENPDGEYDKQDCEQKAFVRLARKLKSFYSRLPLCIIADGLYPNQTFFNICQDNNWSWIVTFQDGNLPSVWEDVKGLQKITENNSRQSVEHREGKEIHHTYVWINDIDYKGFKLHWFECLEEADTSKTRFVHVSNMEVGYFNVLEITETGRMRWKIENEGFNIQKNHGYGLNHKYSRVSMTATKNYYQCMQIAHIINQLFELGSLFKPLLQGKMTIIHLWEKMLGQMRELHLKRQKLEELLEMKIQIRYG